MAVSLIQRILMIESTFLMRLPCCQTYDIIENLSSTLDCNVTEKVMLIWVKIHQKKWIILINYSVAKYYYMFGNVAICHMIGFILWDESSCIDRSQEQWKACRMYEKIKFSVFLDKNRFSELTKRPTKKMMRNEIAGGKISSL